MAAPSAALRLLLAASALRAAAPAVVDYPITDARVRLVGRRVPAASGGVSIDWEGSRATFAVANATFVGVRVSDLTLRGARFAVVFDNRAKPGASDQAPALRVQTLLTTPGRDVLYTLASRAPIVGEAATFALVLLTEPSFIGDASAAQALTLEGVATDGTLLPQPQPRTARRMEFMGDSLTAGYGSGFDAPIPADGSAPSACGAGTLINDYGNSYASLLCESFGAECHTEAQSGITLALGTPNLPQLFELELGSMLSWANATRAPFSPAGFVPDAVLINLGENDANANAHCFDGTDPACTVRVTAAFVSFVQRIDAVYGPPASQRTFFLAIAPHEKGQHAAILPAVAQLVALGIDAVFLNATVNESVAGCVYWPARPFASERARTSPADPAARPSTLRRRAPRPNDASPGVRARAAADRGQDGLGVSRARVRGEPSC